MPKIQAGARGSTVLTGPLVAAGLSAALCSFVVAAQVRDTDTAKPEPLPTVPIDVPDKDESGQPTAERPTKLEPIEVTGSHIKRTDFESVHPIFVLTREDIDRTGISALGDLLQNLSSAGGGAQSSQINWGGYGATEFDFRHLTATRTLLLVDGHRWVGGMFPFFTSDADYSTIPLSIVDRIEIMMDGGSAVYGADAIAGVVNIITRKQYTGAEFRTQWQASDNGGELVQSHGFSTGNVFGRTSIFLDASYARQEAIIAGDRDRHREVLPGTGRTRGNPINPEGHFIFVPNEQNSAALGTGSSDDPDARCSEVVSGVVGGQLGVDVPTAPFPAGLAVCDITRGSGAAPYPDFARYAPALHAYNHITSGFLLLPFEQTGIFLRAGHTLNNSVRLSGTLLYNDRKTAQQYSEPVLLAGDLLAGFAPFDSVYVASDNIFNPFAQDIGRADASNLIGLGLILRRLVELGPQQESQHVKTVHALGSVSGVANLLEHPYDWDLTYTLTQSEQDGRLPGLLDMRNVARALGPGADCPGSGAGVGDCVPLNIFGGPGSITPEMLGYILYNGSYGARHTRHAVYASATSDFGVIPEILAGPIGAAAGLEFRQEDYYGWYDPMISSGATSHLFQFQTTDGGYWIGEGYAEFKLPLIGSAPLAQALDLELAARYSEYQTVGGNVSEKIGLRWKPYDDLLVRTAWSNPFRAPSIGDLHFGGLSLPIFLPDPCSSYNDSGRDDEPNIENIRQNCASDGVPAEYSQPDSDIFPVTYRGNPDIHPEKAETFTTGIVYSPSYNPDLALYLDYYRVRIDDYIDFPIIDSILPLCYAVSPGSRSLCQLVHRSADGSISHLQNGQLNYSEVETQGYTFNGDYRVPLAGWGAVKLSLNGHYIRQYDVLLPTPDGDARLRRAGKSFGVLVIPRVKAALTLGWEKELWEASWTTRYIHHVLEPCDDGLQPSLKDLGLCSQPNGQFVLGDTVYSPINELEAIYYHDVQMGYRHPAWNTDFVLGVNNLFREQPPLSTYYPALLNTSYNPLIHDTGDRTPYVRIHFQF